MRSGIPESGSLKSNPLASMLVYIARNRITGTLSITSQGITKNVYFQKGVAVFASSNYDNDRLGETLVKTGAISIRQFDEGSAVVIKSGKRLGSVLVEQGVLTPKDLFWAVKYQVREIIFSLFALKDALYDYIEGSIPPEVITLDMSMANIILEGVRRIDDLPRIRSEMPGLSEVFMLSDDPMELFQDMDLTDRDRDVLLLVDGKRSHGEILESSKHSDFETMKVLYTLWRLGFITEQFNLQRSGLTLDEILRPMEERKEEYQARLKSTHALLGSLGAYQLLGLAKEADVEAINRQYYKLTKDFHPDRCVEIGEPGMRDMAADVFDALTAAYKELKRRQLTRQYTEGDQALAAEMLKYAKVELKNGGFKEAVKFLQEAVKADPDNAECWNHLSLALSRMPDRFKEAEEAIMNAEGLAPNNSDYAANRGLLYLSAGKPEEAKPHFERALQLNPGNHKAQKGLGKVI